MSHILDAAYILAMLVMAPVVLVKAVFSDRWREGWAQRFGWVPAPKAGDGPCVWIHAVSVGEAALVRSMVDAIRRGRPGWRIAISTFTNTGYRVARERYGDTASVFYFPLDLSFVVNRVMRRVRPDAIALVELEIWPNFLRAARRRGVPVVIVNGRMREEKVRRYAMLKWLWSPLRDPATRNAYCVQNETYADRFRCAGFPGERVRVTGAMKYDSVAAEADPAKLAELRLAFGLREGERLWIGACTWPGEEEICLEAHRRLLKDFPDLRLILAPRHIERAEEVRRAVLSAGFACHRRSAGSPPSDAGCVLLLDTVGELSTAYALAEAAFVGKSLTAAGGHNVLEPAALGVPVVFGPKTDNFRQETAVLVEANAAKLVKDAEGVYTTVFHFLSDKPARDACGRRGRDAVLRKRGATELNLAVLCEAICEQGARNQ